MEKNWFQRQLSAQTSQDHDYSFPSEYAAAVAASAFAVHNLEEAQAENRRKAREDFEASREKMKSKTIDVKPGVSGWSSYKETGGHLSSSQSHSLCNLLPEN